MFGSQIEFYASDSYTKLYIDVYTCHKQRKYITYLRNKLSERRKRQCYILQLSTGIQTAKDSSVFHEMSFLGFKIRAGRIHLLCLQRGHIMQSVNSDSSDFPKMKTASWRFISISEEDIFLNRNGPLACVVHNVGAGWGRNILPC